MYEQEVETVSQCLSYKFYLLFFKPNAFQLPASLFVTSIPTQFGLYKRGINTFTQ
jgi:hypothetical protein